MLGIRGYRFVKQKIVPGGIEFTIECHAPVCPCCGSANVWRKGFVARSFRSAPIGSKKTTILIDVPRVYCRDCKSLRQVRLSFAEEHKRHTRFFTAHVLDLLLSMTYQDVADHLGMSWDTVRDIKKTSLKRHFEKPPLKDVTHVAVDEIAVQKGHKYLTVVMDLKSGSVIFVGDGQRKGVASRWPSASHGSRVVASLAFHRFIVYMLTPASNASGLLRRRGSVEPGCSGLPLQIVP